MAHPPQPAVYALIVAAGSGERMGGDVPKQYRRMAGKTILQRSVEAFKNHSRIQNVCVVIHPHHVDLYNKALGHLDLMPPAMGGAQRQDSVRAGVEHLFSLNIPDDAYILVHDAARCMVEPDTISKVLEALKTAKAALPTTPVRDTLKKVNLQHHVAATVLRENLFHAQTPQGFHGQVLRHLHTKYADQSFTDDVALAEAESISVRCVEGSEGNIKLTTDADWQLLEAKLNRTPEFRTGMGFDVHKLVAANNATVQLCGIAIPHSHALQGHSDADVALHALVDALLGAICAGDIGEHFPPSDPTWKGADSSDFVTHAVKLVRDAGAEITHADMTIICEAPKLSSHKSAMREKIASLLGLGIDRISVKATTTEKLGFTGRGEGIAAQSIVTIKL